MVSWMVEGCLIPVVATFGLVGNIVSISILQDRSLDMKATFREILIMLAVFDTIFVLSATISFSLPIMFQQWKVRITTAAATTAVSGKLFVRKTFSSKSNIYKGQK